MTVHPRDGLPGSIALVQDALPVYGGAERVLETVGELFPHAPIHALVFNRPAFAGTPLADREVLTSFLDRLPGARRHHRRLLPLFPLAIESLDFTPYDMVVSFHYAVAHGALTRPDQLHVSYTYTPLRQAWHFHHEYLRSLPAASRVIARPILHYVRLWDRAAADRVDRFVAISRWVAACIWRAYRRRAPVVYPPVDVEAFVPNGHRGDYYVTVTRLEPHKRVDLVVEAFAGLDRPLLVVGAGPEHAKLARRATSNIEFLGRVTDAQLADVLGRARGLVHAAEEDFGIALVEAQAAGCPVVAYSGGGASETVLDGRTGVLFHRQTAEAVREAVRSLELVPRLSDVDMRRNAEQYSKASFKARFERLLEREWALFRTGRPGGRGKAPRVREPAAWPR
jgi:glycosyltransferase involved in cell wall biosynthesis